MEADLLYPGDFYIMLETGTFLQQFYNAQTLNTLILIVKPNSNPKAHIISTIIKKRLDGVNHHTLDTI